MFKTHKNNILGIKAALKVYPEIWFHGDGNIYHKEYESETRQKYSNPLPGGGINPGTYRIKFKASDEIPETVEEMNEAFMVSKNKEFIEASKPKEQNGVATFSIDIPKEEGVKSAAKPVDQPVEEKPKEELNTTGAGAKA